MQIALRFYGLRRGQAGLAKIIGTTEDGSDHHDLIHALSAVGLHPNEFSTNNTNEARKWISDLACIVPLLICVDDWEHWVCVAGQCANRVTLYDPDPDQPQNRLVNGATPLRIKTVLKRWKAARSLAKQEGEPVYYGIAVLPASDELP